MNTDIAPFGIVVCVSPGDYLFGKGTCASINYFMPDVPITLLVDGPVDTNSLEETYQQLLVIRKKDIDDPWLREHSFGWGITKMLAFFYAPYEHFLYVDSDTVLWGDIRQRIQPDQYDYIADIPYRKDKAAVSTQEISTWFFDPDFVEKTFPDFPWQQYKEQFMCPGGFFGSRQAFTLNEYKEMLALKLKNPYSMHFGDMGFHNIMVFRKYHQERLNLGFADYQTIFPDFSQSELRQRFIFDGETPIVVPGDEQVLHMPDKKPLVNNPDCYSDPMTYFRLKFLEDSEGLQGKVAKQRLLAEDKEYFRLRQKSLRKNRVDILKRLFQGHPAEWRRLVQRFA